MTPSKGLTNTDAVLGKGVAGSAWVSAFALFLMGAFPLYSVDAYGHLAQGRQIAQLGGVPKFDPFSFWKPSPAPWSNYEWAYDLLSWLLYDRFGPNALILIKCILLALLGYVLVLLAIRLAERAAFAAPLAATIAILFAPLARIRFTIRPQIIGLLCPAVLLLGIHALYSERSSSRAKLALVFGLGAMQLVWVNMHGSHLLGLLITAMFLLFSIRTGAFVYMLSLLIVQALATFCTPFGIDIVSDAVSHVFRPEYRELVTEWSPWSPGNPLYLLLGPMAAAVLVLVAMRPVVRGSRYGMAYGVFCVLVSLMAFRSIRFVAHQLLLTAPFIGAGLAQLDWIRSARRSVALALVLAFAGSLWIAPRLEPFVPFGFGEPRLGHPFAVAEVIRANVEDPRILAPIQDSWPLMFAVPKAKFLIDGRVPFYGPEFVRRVTNSFSDPAALNALIAEYGVDTIVLDHVRADQSAAVEYLSRSSDWVLGQVQDRHSLFVRPERAHSMLPLQVIGAGYRVGRLLDPDVSDAQIEAEVRRLSSHQSSNAIRGWVQGLRALRALARDGGRAGVRIARTEAERASAREAYRQLSEAAAVYPGFTSIEVYRTMAALAACDETSAREALAWAAYSGETRETSLLAIELALRMDAESRRAAAESRILSLAREARSAEDPWVAAIARDLEARCP